MYYPKLVLLIDDDEEDHYIFSTALTACCETVELISEKTGPAALKRLHDETSPVPDMVLLDWFMPMVSGREILAAIRQLPRYAYIPVILLSGGDPNDYQKEAKELGATHFLQKASTLRELEQKLKVLFSQHWKQQP